MKPSCRAPSTKARSSVNGPIKTDYHYHANINSAQISHQNSPSQCIKPHSTYYLLSGRIALVAQPPIVVKLSCGRSVGLLVRMYVRRSVGLSISLSVSLSSALWQNGGSDSDAVWHHRSDGSRDEAGSGVCGSVHGKGYFSGKIWGAIVTNGDFTVYVCDSGVMWPSSQITLGKLVIYYTNCTHSSFKKHTVNIHQNTVEFETKKLN